MKFLTTFLSDHIVNKAIVDLHNEDIRASERQLMKKQLESITNKIEWYKWKVKAQQEQIDTLENKCQNHRIENRNLRDALWKAKEEK